MKSPQDIQDLIKWYDSGGKPDPGTAVEGSDDLVNWHDDQMRQNIPANGGADNPPALPKPPALPVPTTTDKVLGAIGSVLQPTPAPAPAAPLAQAQTQLPKLFVGPLQPNPFAGVPTDTGLKNAKVTIGQPVPYMPLQSDVNAAGLGPKPAAPQQPPQGPIPTIEDLTHPGQTPSQIAGKVMTSPLGPVGPVLQQGFEEVAKHLNIPAVDIQKHPVAAEIINQGAQLLDPQTVGIAAAMVGTEGVTAGTILAPYVHAIVKGTGAGFAIAQFGNFVDQSKQADDLNQKATYEQAAGNLVAATSYRSQAQQLKVKAVSSLIQAGLGALPEAIDIGKKAMGTMAPEPVAAPGAGDAEAAAAGEQAKRRAYGAQGDFTPIEVDQPGDAGDQAAFNKEPVSHASARDSEQTRFGREYAKTPPGEPSYAEDRAKQAQEEANQPKKDPLDEEIERLQKEMGGMKAGSPSWERLNSKLKAKMAEKAAKAGAGQQQQQAPPPPPPGGSQNAPPPPGATPPPPEPTPAPANLLARNQPQIDRVRGNTDIPLNEAGKAQVADLGRKVAEKGGFDEVLTSDLSRTHDTAKAIAGDAPITVNPDLRDMNYGKNIEGRPTKDVIGQINAGVIDHPGIPIEPDGESFNHYMDRVQPVIADAAKRAEAENKKIAIVANRRTIKTEEGSLGANGKFDDVIDRGIATSYEPGQTQNASIYRIDKTGDGTYKLVDMDHLNAPGDLEPGHAYLVRHGETDWNAPQGAPQARPDEAKSQRVADYYEAAKSNPNDPKVKAAYDAFNNETHAQFEALKAAGYTFTPVEHPETYQDSQSMFKDVNENKHLDVWTGGTPQHGLMNPQQNFEFRAVHDVLGHTKSGGTFGHAGEEEAYKSHYAMYSPEAQKAMATETRGQNATVHFGKGTNNPKETLYQDAGTGGDNLNFPEQKAIVLPHELRSIMPEEAEGLGLARRQPIPGVASSTGKPNFEVRTGKHSTIYITREAADHINDLYKKAGLMDEDVSAYDMAVGRGQSNMLVNLLGKDNSPISREALRAIAELQRTQGTLKPYKLIMRPGEMETKPPSFVMPRRGDPDLPGAAIRGPVRREPRPISEAVISQRHEGNHVNLMDYMRGAGFSAQKFINDLGALPPRDRGIVGQALRNLRARGYDPRHWAIELPAHVISGDNTALGITKAENAILYGHILDALNNQLPKDLVGEAMKGFHPSLKEAYEGKFNPSTMGIRPDEAPRNVPPARPSSSYSPVPAGASFEGGGPSPVFERKRPNPSDDEFRRQYESRVRPSYLPPENTATKLTQELGKAGLLGFDSIKDAKYAILSYPDWKDRWDVRPEIRPEDRRLALLGDQYRDEVLQDTEPPEPRNKFEGHSPIKVRQFGPDGELPPKWRRPVVKYSTDLEEAPEISAKDWDTLHDMGVLYRKRPSIERHLQPDERGRIKNEQALYDAFDALPKVGDVKQAALAGAAGKYWYENSGRAIKAAVGPEDAKQFAQLLAALSPRQPITQNVRGAVAAWKEWNAEGRPTDEASIREILKRPGVHGYVAMENRTGNAVRVLQGDPNPLEGLKVDSFTQNLLGNAEKSTNDVHIARFAGVMQKVFAKPEGYYATQALIRQTAQEMGWTPMQVQAAVWTWARPFYELARNKNASIKDLVRAMGPVSQKDVSDFGSIMLNDPEVRSALDEVLKQRGSSLEKFDREFQKHPLQYGTEEAVPPRFSKAYEQRAADTVARERAELREKSENKRLTKEPGLFRRQPEPEEEFPLAKERPGERGSIRVRPGAGGKKNPLPNSPTYTKIWKAQNQPKPPSLMDQWNALKDKSAQAYKDHVYRWADFAKIADDMRSRGIPIPPGLDPEIAVNIQFGGGMGSSEATALDSMDIRNEAKKAGLLQEVEAYLNLTGHEREISRGLPSSGYTFQTLTNDWHDLTQHPKFAEIESIAKKEIQLNRDVLDAYHDHGFVSDAGYKTMVDRGDYVNMKRMLDDIDEEQRRSGASFGVRQQQGIKALKGTNTLYNVSPFAADVEQRSTMLRDIAKAEPIKVLHKASLMDPQGLGTVVRELTPGQSLKRGEGTRHYYRDGKPVTIAMPKDLANVLEMSSAQEVRLLGDALLGGLANVSRSSFTGMNLAYGVTAPIRQALDSYAMLGSFTPADALHYAKNMAQALGHTLAKDDVYREALRAGIGYTGLQTQIDPYAAMRPSDFKNFFTPKEWLQHPLKTALIPLTDPLTQIAKLSHLVQTADKIGARQFLIDKGMNPTQATFEARRFAGRPDVANAGIKSRQMNRIMLFMTDYMKGFERNLQFANGHKGKIAALVGAMLLGWMAIMRHNAQMPSPEGDGTMEWDHVSDNDKENNLIWLTDQVMNTSEGGKRLVGVKFPLPKFIGTFLGRPLQAIAEKTYGHLTTKQALLNSLSGTIPGTPVLKEGEAPEQAVRAAAGMVVPALQEGIEQVANQDTRTGEPILPESQRQIKPVEFQRRLNTSPTMIEIGRRLGLSPIRLEHAMKSVLGGTGESLSTLSDAAIQAGKKPPATYPYESTEKATHIPFVGPLVRRFVTSPTDQMQLDAEKKFYTNLADAGDATDSINKLLSKAVDRREALISYLDNPRGIALASEHQNLVNLATEFSDYRQSIVDIAADKTKTVDQKRQEIHDEHLKYMKALASANANIDTLVDHASRGGKQQRLDTLNYILSRSNRTVEPEEPEENGVQ